MSKIHTNAHSRTYRIYHLLQFSQDDSPISEDTGVTGESVPNSSTVSLSIGGEASAPRAFRYDSSSSSGKTVRVAEMWKKGLSAWSRKERHTPKLTSFIFLPFSRNRHWFIAVQSRGIRVFRPFASATTTSSCAISLRSFFLRRATSRSSFVEKAQKSSSREIEGHAARGSEKRFRAQGFRSTRPRGQWQREVRVRGI